MAEVCLDAQVLASTALMTDEKATQRLLTEMEHKDGFSKIGDKTREGICDVRIQNMLTGNMLNSDLGAIAKEKIARGMANFGNSTKGEILSQLNDFDKFSEKIASDTALREEINKISGGDIDQAIEQYRQYMANKWGLEEHYAIADNELIEKTGTTQDILETDMARGIANDKIDDMIANGSLNGDNQKKILSNLRDYKKELDKENISLVEKQNKLKGKRGVSNRLEQGRIKKQLENIYKKQEVLNAYIEKIESIKFKKVKSKTKVEEPKKKGRKKKVEEKTVQQVSLFDEKVISEETGDGIAQQLKQNVIDVAQDISKKSVLTRERRIELLKELIEKKQIKQDQMFLALRDVLGDEKAYNNYVVARILLSEGDVVAEGLLKDIATYTLGVGKLTDKIISDAKTLEDLVSIAYSFADELKKSKVLRVQFLSKKDMILQGGDDALGTAPTKQRALITALNNLSSYGDDFYASFQVDNFVNNFKAMGYKVPEGISGRELYENIAYGIITGKTIELGDVKFVKNDYETLILLYQPKDFKTADIKEIIAAVGLSKYRETLKASLQSSAEVRAKSTIQSIYNETKLKDNIKKFQEMLDNPNSSERTAIIFKALTGLNIDEKNTVFIGKKERKFERNTDSQRDIAQKILTYDDIAKSNSIKIGKGFGHYKDTDAILQELKNNPKALDGVEYIVTDGTSFYTRDIQKFIEEYNRSYKKNIILIDKNKFSSQGRFYYDEEKGLMYSLVNNQGLSDFLEKLGQLPISLGIKAERDVSTLREHLYSYINSVFGDGSADDIFGAIQELIGFPVLPKRSGANKVGGKVDFDIDWVKLEKAIDQSLQTTGKYRIDKVNLGEAYDNLPNSLNGYKAYAQRFAKDLGLEINDELVEKIDMQTAKDFLFDALYNTNITDGINAKYNFLKLFGATGVANENDKVLGISYIFNKELLKGEFNMPMFIPDGFIKKLLDGDNVRTLAIEDTWAMDFIKKNGGNPKWKEIPGENDVEKFNTLITNLQETIQFEKLKNQLSFPSGIEDVKHIPHEGDAYVYRMVGGDNDRYLAKLDEYGLQLGKEIKPNMATLFDEEKLINEILDMYEADIKKIAKGSNTSYRDALELKQRVGFALDTIEQKVIIPKYGDSLSIQGKEDLLGKKSLLPIITDESEINYKYFQEDLENLRKMYKNIGNTIRKDLTRLSSLTPTERLDRLKETGVVKVIDSRGGVVNLTTLDMFRDFMSDIDNVARGEGWDSGARQLASIDEETFKALPRESQISVLEKLSLIKKANDFRTIWSKVYGELYTSIRMNDFFANYMLDSKGFPRIFNNVLANYRWLAPNANLTQDTLKGILETSFETMMGRFFTNGKTVDEAENMSFISKFKTPTLSDIRSILSDTIDDVMIYAGEGKQVKAFTDDESEELVDRLLNIFQPYAELQGMSENVGRLVQDKLTKTFDNFMEQLGFTKEEALRKYGDLELYEGRTVSDILNSETADQSLPAYLRNSNGDRVELSRIQTNKSDIDVERDIAKVNDTLTNYINQYSEVLESERQIAADALRGIAHLFSRNSQLNRIKETQELLQADAERLANEFDDLIMGGFSSKEVKEAISKDKKSGIDMAWKTVQSKLAKYSRIFSLADGVNKGFNENALNQFKTAYLKYYSMDYNALMSITENNIENNTERVALGMAQYFRQLGERIGSVDGVRGTTQSQEVNRALYNIGDCVLGLSSSNATVSLIGALNQGSLFRFEQLMPKNVAGYNETLARLGGYTKLRDDGLKGVLNRGVNVGSEGLLLKEDLGGDTVSEFNALFNSNFSSDEVNQIVRALSGTKMGGWYNKTIGRILKGLRKSSVVERFAISYPGQLLTIPYQIIGYSVRREGLTKGLGVSGKDMSKANGLRRQLGILEGQYFELGYRGAYDEVDLGEVGNTYSKIYNEAGIRFGDSGEQITQKLTRWMASGLPSRQNVSKALDNVKDNPNNLIDGFFSAGMKDISFMTALKNNRYRKFFNTDELVLFLKDERISKAEKKKVLDELKYQSSRCFNNIMGVGQSGVFSMMPKSTIGEFGLDIMNLINFRGQRGTNIMRQGITRIKEFINAGSYWMKNANKPGITNEIIDYFSHNIEFKNMINAIVSDMYYASKMAREWDRNQSNDDWGDTVEDVLAAAEFTSMYIQGLQSAGLGRLLFAGGEQWSKGGEYGHDFNTRVGETLMAVANSFTSNLGRNFKFSEYVTKCMEVWVENDFDTMREYVGNTFRNLSLSSLNYMLSDSNYLNYNNNVDITAPRSLVIGSASNKDNALINFANNYGDYVRWRTRNNDKDGKTELDFGDLVSTLFNKSRMIKTLSNISKTVEQTKNRLSTDAEDQAAFEKNRILLQDWSEFADVVDEQPVWLEFNRTGLISFSGDNKDRAEIMMKKFMNKDFPGGSNFYDNLDKRVHGEEIDWKGNETRQQDFEWLMSKLSKEEWTEMLNQINIEKNQKGYTAMQERQLELILMQNKLEQFQDDYDYPYIASRILKGYNALDYDMKLDARIAQDTYNKKTNPEGGWFGKKEDWKDVYEREFMAEYCSQNQEEWAKQDHLAYTAGVYSIMFNENEEAFAPRFSSYVDSDGVVQHTLKTSYKKTLDSELNAIVEFEKGHPLEGIAATSLLTKQLDYLDKSGTTALSEMQMYMEYIDNSSYSQTLKAYMKSKLAIENIDVLKKGLDYESVLGENNYVVSTAFNILYDVRDTLSDAISEVAQSYETGNDKNGKTGTGNSLRKLKTTNIELNKLTGQYGGGRRKSNTTPNYNFKSFEVRGAEFLNSLAKNKTPNTKGYEKGIQVNKYTEVPLLAQPKMGTPKKMKGEKKKVKVVS